MKPKKCSKPPPREGQALKGPIGLVSQTGTSWHLPNCAVEKPFSFRSRPATRAALLSGRNHHSVGMGGITEIATSAPGYNSVRPNTAAPVPPGDPVQIRASALYRRTR
jgi:hypothetical protein